MHPLLHLHVQTQQTMRIYAVNTFTCLQSRLYKHTPRASPVAPGKMLAAIVLIIVAILS